MIFEHLYVVENRQIEVLVLLRKLPTFPTWQQRQGKAGRDCYNRHWQVKERNTSRRKWDSGEEKQTAEEAARGGGKEEGADTRTQT